MKTFFDKLYAISKAAVIIAPFVLFGWLISKDLVMGGHLEFYTDFNSPNAVITPLFPADRISKVSLDAAGQNFASQINSEPVYFEVRLPQKFETATVKIEYQSKNLPLIQMGLLTIGQQEWNYYFKPMESLFLDNLAWFKLEGNNGTLWQRQKKYLNWDQFISELKTLKNVYAFNYNLPGKSVISDLKQFGQLSEADYLASDYQTPKLENGFKTTRINFDLSQAQTVNRKLRFAISAPELNNSGQKIIVKSVAVILDKQPLTYGQIINKIFAYVGF